MESGRIVATKAVLDALEAARRRFHNLPSSYKSQARQRRGAGPPKQPTRST